MEWNKRKLFIMYVIFLFISFLLGAMIFHDDNITQYEITCENGSVVRFNLSDEFICGGHPNPLREDIIETNISLIIENFK